MGHEIHINLHDHTSIHLLGGWPTPLKHISQLGWSFPRYGKNKFQNTNQILVWDYHIFWGPFRTCFNIRGDYMWFWVILQLPFHALVLVILVPISKKSLYPWVVSPYFQTHTHKNTFIRCVFKNHGQIEYDVEIVVAIIQWLPPFNRLHPQVQSL